MNSSLSNASQTRAATEDMSTSFTRTAQLATIVAYSVMFLFSLIGNLMTVFLVAAKPHMRSITNCLIANMAVADLLMTLSVMPHTVAFTFVQNLWFGGVFGTVLCKIVYFSVPASIAASIITLVVISLDRFFVIVYPFKRASIIRNISVTCVVIWVVSIILASPYLYSFKVFPIDDRFYCFFSWEPLADTIQASRFYYSFIFVFLYTIPLAVIVVFYSIVSFKLWKRRIPGNPTAVNRRNAELSKRRTIKMLIIIVIVFALCWLPAHLMHLLSFFHPSRMSISNTTRVVAFGISHANSAVNPYLYIALNRNFRRAFWEGLFCSGSRVSDVTNQQHVAYQFGPRHVRGRRSGAYELGNTKNFVVMTGDRPINLLKMTVVDLKQTNLSAN